MKKLLSTLFIVCSFLFAFNLQNVDAATANVTMTSVKNTKTGIQLKWKAKSKASGYIIYRSENDSKFEKYEEVRSKKYTDTNVETGNKYKYYIISYKYSNHKKKYSKKSNISDEIEAIPFAVTSASAFSFADRIMISWNKNPYASGYDIYRSIDDKTWTYCATLQDDVNSFDDYIVDWSLKYSYKIKVFEYVDGVKYYSNYSSVIKSNGKKGIDVSYHNGKINWKKVKNSGVSFAMIRLGYGETTGGVTDSKLEYNYVQAKKYGVKVGFYFYSYATSKKTALKEAKYTLKLLKKYPDVDFPVAFDFENQSRNKKKYKSANTKIIMTYCDYLEKYGYDTCVYSFEDFFKRATDYKKISKYGLWVARWTYSSKKYKTTGLPNVQMWQYSDKGKVKGIYGYTDLNILLKEY